MATSIFSRKADLVYLTFFIIHVPLMIMVDFVPLYPEWAKLQVMKDLRVYYITTYQDQFFVAPPAWFSAFTWLELLYHLPLSLWAIPALIRDDPKVPIHLLIWACETALTTFTCIADYLSWSNFSNDQKINLGALYVPYFILAVVMLVDMFSRLDAKIGRLSTANAAKKTA